MDAPRHDTKMSTKGHVILPKAVRDRMSWPPRTELTVEITGKGGLLTPKTPLFPPTRHEDVFGMLKYGGPPISVEEMNASVGRMLAARRDRGRY